jgi:glutamine cyclotransferase
MKRSKADIVAEHGPYPGTDGVHGVTCDGEHVWFASGARLNVWDPASARVLRSIDIAAHAGTAFDGRHLFQIAEDRIHKIDPATGAILRTIESDRFVTGVTWVDGECWHGTWENDESALRHIDPTTGEVLEQLDMPPGAGISGLAAEDGQAVFYCGGGHSGKLRVVKRPRSVAAAG